MVRPRWLRRPSRPVRGAGLRARAAPRRFAGTPGRADPGFGVAEHPGGQSPVDGGQRRPYRAGTLTFSGERLLPVDLAVRAWARRDEAVAERLRRVDNHRMDLVGEVIGSFCADPMEVEARSLLAFCAAIGGPLPGGGPRGFTREQVFHRAADLLLDRSPGEEGGVAFACASEVGPGGRTCSRSGRTGVRGSSRPWVVPGRRRTSCAGGSVGCAVPRAPLGRLPPVVRVGAGRDSPSSIRHARSDVQWSY